MMNFRKVFYGLIAVVLVTPAEPQTVSPYDYEVPVSDASLLRVGGSYLYSDLYGRSKSNSGRIVLTYDRYYNSLPFAWDLEFEVEGRIRRTGEEKQKGTYSIEASPGIRRYFNPLGNVFYSGELSVYKPQNIDRADVFVTPGLGYGRFIHVTPLALAVRIEEFLLEEGLIKGPLSKETLVALAQVIARKSEFRTEFGRRYRVRWFEAMEKVIAGSGMLIQGGIGAVGTMRVNEVLLNERVNQRTIGWSVRTGVEFQALTRHSPIPRSDPRLSLLLRYSRPIGWKSQFGVDAEYTTPISGDFGYDVFGFEFSLHYLYEVTNRIDFTLSSITTVERRDLNVETIVSENVQSEFIFYIENQINFSISGEYALRRDRNPRRRLYMTIGYRLH